MALWTDRDTFSIIDLQKHESAISEEATLEGLDVEAKWTVSRDEIATFLIEFLNVHGGANGTAMLDNVTLTEPLRRWHSLLTLALCYRDLQTRHASDKYQRLYTEYLELSKEAKAQLIASGIGLVNDPAPKPAQPIVTLTGGTIDEGFYYIATAFLSNTGAQGTVSEPAAVQLTTPGGLSISIGTNTGHKWNIFVGSTAEQLFLQTSSPVSETTNSVTLQTLSTQTWNGKSQVADYYLYRNQKIRLG